jgi:hypothetical protein
MAWVFRPPTVEQSSLRVARSQARSRSSPRASIIIGSDFDIMPSEDQSARQTSADLSISTLAALQRLNDATFHRLCDELIPRVHSRYFPLTPHGISPEGLSIKGQPDSFVGDSIATASIALCYSVQKHRWWTKLQDDVQSARAACPVAVEVVWATSRDTERDGRQRPKDWLWKAAAAGGTAKLTIFSGKRLSQQLDTDHQDLRFEYLKIPQSRGSYQSLIMACRQRTSGTIRVLKRTARYDPAHYVVRRADGTLFELWQACGPHALSRERPRFIPLVSDAGLGKTSLLCRFAESFPPGLAMLFVAARDLSWEVEDTLVRYVVQEVYSGPRISDQAIS